MNSRHIYLALLSSAILMMATGAVLLVITLTDNSYMPQPGEAAINFSPTMSVRDFGRMNDLDEDSLMRIFPINSPDELDLRLASLRVKVKPTIEKTRRERARQDSPGGFGRYTLLIGLMTLVGLVDLGAALFLRSRSKK